MFRRNLTLAQEYLAFLLLNLFDLFLTGYIFRHDGGEANGAAVLIMEHFGLSGFVVYKFLLVTVVILACEGIARASIRKSKMVITAGILVYLAIVLYEAYLIASNIHKLG